MDFTPAPDDELAAATARAFAERELAPRAAARDRSHEFPVAECRRLGELGFLGLTVSAALGGSAAGPIAAAMVIAELARADASVAVTVSVTNMVAEILARCATAEAQQAHLPRLCSGDALAGAFALSEPQAGSDPRAITTTVERAPGGGYLLNGNKLWTTSGDRAGVLIVAARHGASMGAPGYSSFVLGAPTPGLTAGRPEQKMGQHGSSTVALTLDNVAVPAHGLLSAEGEGLKVALAGLGSGRIGIAALSVGLGRAALEVAVRHVRDRRQFGAPLADTQAIRFMLADSATALDAAWLLTLRAAWCKQQGLPFVRAACQAKLMASERANEICDRAVQMLGGYGYTREFPVERYFRDARVTTIYEGTSQIQRLVIARELLREARGGGTTSGGAPI